MIEKRRHGFWGTLGCFVGLHDWSCAFFNQPPHCKRCGKWQIPRRVNQRGNIVMGDMAGGDIVKPKQPNGRLDRQEEAHGN